MHRATQSRKRGRRVIAMRSQKLRKYTRDSRLRIAGYSPHRMLEIELTYATPHAPPSHPPLWSPMSLKVAQFSEVMPYSTPSTLP